jgi:hypothetical protein
MGCANAEKPALSPACACFVFPSGTSTNSMGNSLQPFARFGTFPATNPQIWIAGKVKPSDFCNRPAEHLSFTQRPLKRTFLLPESSKVCILCPEDFPMKVRKLLLGCILCLGLFASGVLVGQDVSPRRHPNLFAAQRFIEQAIGKVDAAQAANEFDMGGHAAKAKEHLAKAYEEIKQAAEAANRH